MRFVYIVVYLFLFAGIIVSCRTSYMLQSVENRSVEVKGEAIDSGLYRMLFPFREQMSRQLEEVVGYAAQDLVKAQPECNLGNFMADALMQTAEDVYGIRPHAAFMNYGGIRLPLIKEGPITIGKVYELFPFDNLLVLVAIRGDVLLQFLDHVAGRGGWPVAGIKMKIREKKAIDVLINNRPLHADSSYVIAIGDYTANGGDDAVMLKGLPQQNKGFLMRDALLTYLRKLQKEGKVLKVEKENRVIYAE